MIAALLLACLPDLQAFTPTPTIAWDRVSYCFRYTDDPLWTIDCDLGAYRIMMRRGPFGAWTLAYDSPCFWYVAPGEEPLHQCNAYAVPQRFTDDPLEEVDWCVKAVNAYGVESVDCSNVVDVCMPEVWPGPPAPYE